MYLIFKQNRSVKNPVRKKYYFKSCWYVMILYFPKFVLSDFQSRQDGIDLLPPVLFFFCSPSLSTIVNAGNKIFLPHHA